MREVSSLRLFFALFCISFLLAISLMAEGADKSTGDSDSAAVHIVYVDRPESEDPEAFHIRTLASVVGSEETAREMVIYHYKHAASGFSAKLTPKQVEDLSQQPQVLQVMPDKVLQLHSDQKRVGTMGLM